MPNEEGSTKRSEVHGRALRCRRRSSPHWEEKRWLEVKSKLHVVFLRYLRHSGTR